jgi:hypothetical protein
MELQYHTGPKKKPTSTREEFAILIKSLKNMSVRFNERTAKVGKNSKTGEKVTFHFTFDV